MMDTPQWEGIQWEVIRSHLKIMLRILVHLEEEDEDEDEDEDHAANDGENIDDMDQYEERIE